jgi:thiamine transporter
MTQTRTRLLVEIALTIALSAVFHFVKLWQMPFGGSISLEMLPIFVLAIRRGAVVGVIAGALYGFVDFFLEPYVVHWVQFLLDYPLAYGAVGLAGLWAPLWRRLVSTDRLAQAVFWVVPAAVITGAIGRYLAHFISGLVFFATVAMGGPLTNGQSPFGSVSALQAATVYSALYNLYVPLSAAGCIVALFFIMPTLEKTVPSTWPDMRS